MARKTSGRKLVEKTEGSEEAQLRLKLIFETMSGAKSIPEACGILGISESRFHQMREEALQAAVSELELQASGRPKKEASEDERKIEELQDEIERMGIELKASQIREELAIVMPHLLKKGSKKKVPTKQEIFDSQNGGKES